MGTNMKRRDLLQLSAGLGIAASFSRSSLGASDMKAGETSTSAAPAANLLHPPANGHMPVAFLLSDGAVVIDFAGPWEVFEHVAVPGSSVPAFELYTVAETTKPIQTSGGMIVVPNHSFATAPAPKIIVIPAQSEPSEATIKWIRDATKTTDVTMSVCTGAFVLARTGLLSGKQVATHHAAFSQLAVEFPDVQVKRGARFVESGNLATAGGLSSGIDLALHIVERYYGRAVATGTADSLEYQGLGWMDADSNQKYAAVRVSTDEHPLCPVCEMEVDPSSAPSSAYQGRTYYFCMADHKSEFDAKPDKYIHA
jgi:transcriptional regulator GlxA family with amidase domain